MRFETGSQAERADPNAKSIHLKIAALHEQRAALLKSNQNDGASLLFVAEDKVA
ncbi:hypothetical protein OKW76_12340 [Sphingomonas sp. S1-29]|uniref:hypothetical protein n=1 Tax=Sphingomonas sp. S1-29 TaxID=2991074 RepID=UPI0022405E47|nr:hypothetical protein [Sphingomonas sp. S1-29]UZK68822.1 hypothetical protein OKW76_12340 [Sphingomonas sp. S1-29]